MAYRSAIRDRAVELYRSMPELSLEKVVETLRSEFPSERLPSPRTVGNWVNESSNPKDVPRQNSTGVLRPNVAREVIRYLLDSGDGRLFAALSREHMRREIARRSLPPWALDENGEAPGGAWEIMERRRHQPGYKGHNEELLRQLAHPIN